MSAIKRNDLNMWIIYDDNGPVTLKYGSGTFHYVTNPQGDVVAIVGNQGQKLVEYTYDAWGKVTSITGDYAYNLGIHNPILYRGYIYDHETGLYYCQSRYYDPETGRFLNADGYTSTGGLLGNNMFAYCGNNPVNYADPRGLKPGDLFKTMDEAARDAAFYINGKSISENAEYATYIYRVEKKRKEYRYFTFNLFGLEIWIPYSTTETNVYYTYGELVQGDAMQVNPGQPDPSMDAVASFHTHAAYTPRMGYYNDTFSVGDMSTAHVTQLPAYLATPFGQLLFYDLETREKVTLYDDIPFDPSHPKRWRNVG